MAAVGSCVYLKTTEMYRTENGTTYRRPWSINVYTVVPIFIMGTCDIRALCRVLYTPNSAAVIDDTEDSDFGGADGLEEMCRRSCAAGE
jgi:hypothetical protein